MRFLFALTLLTCSHALNLFSGARKSPSPSSSKPLKVAITGSSGLVGSALRKKLEAQNAEVISITRSARKSDANTVSWDVERGILDPASLEGVDVVVHLAGEGVASGSGPLAILGRWDGDKKDKILNSRVDGTKLLVESLSKLKKKPSLFISASAVGFYPYNEDGVYTETSSKGSGFLADVCEAWETEALKAEKSGIRTICARFGIILSKNGGILKKLLPLFSVGGGGLLGNGQQGFSAVSLNDAVNAIDFMIKNYKNKNELRGPVNVCSPTPVNNEIFTQAFGKVISRPTIVPLPEFAAKIVFGQMGEEMLLGGQKVVPNKLIKAGFQFENEDIEDALRASI